MYHRRSFVECEIICYAPSESALSPNRSPNLTQSQTYKPLHEVSRGCQTEIRRLGILVPAVTHQENAESNRKRFQALPVLTVVSKRVEVRGIATYCLDSYQSVLHVLNSDEAYGTRVWNKQWLI